MKHSARQKRSTRSVIGEAAKVEVSSSSSRLIGAALLEQNDKLLEHRSMHIQRRAEATPAPLRALVRKTST
jgi:uncharacterized protein (DUF1778 family)